MPHIIIEYSAESHSKSFHETIMTSAFDTVVDSGLFDEANIKIRLIPIEHYLLAAGKRGFYHIQCRIHRGRTDKQKLNLSKAMVDSLSKLTSHVSVITCEMVEMDRSSYAKWSA